MSLKDRYLTWRRGGAVGCQFARLMAMNPTQYYQHVEVVGGTVAATLASTVEQHVSQCIPNPKVEALTLLFPDVVELRVVVEMALALQTTPAWRVASWLENAPPGQVVAFGVARDVPLANGNPVPSEALMLGDFDIFPTTRRAPIVAMEIFVGVPMANDPKKPDKPTTKANLAHVTVAPPLGQSQFGKVWDASVRGRTNSLGGVDDRRAKARVAFVVPASLAQSLGCAPSSAGSP